MKPLTIKVIDGANLEGGETEVTVRAVYMPDTGVLPVQYKDPTRQLPRAPWQKQADGSWKKLAGPNDKGGDSNLYYEDKWRWSSGTSLAGLRAAQGASRPATPARASPSGTSTPRTRASVLDLWHMKGVRTGTRSGRRPVRGQHALGQGQGPEAVARRTRSTGGGYDDNQTDDKKGPRSSPFRATSRRRPTGSCDSEKEPFDDSKYKAGDEVPGIVTWPRSRRPR